MNTADLYKKCTAVQRKIRVLRTAGEPYKHHEKELLCLVDKLLTKRSHAVPITVGAVGCNQIRIGGCL